MDSGDGLRVIKNGQNENATKLSKEDIAEKQGVALYPGADSPPGQNSVLTGDTQSRYVLILETKDPVKKAVDYYKSKIPVLNGGAHGGGYEFRGLTKDKFPVHLVIGGGDGHTRIQLEIIANTKPPAKA